MRSYRCHWLQVCTSGAEGNLATRGDCVCNGDCKQKETWQFLSARVEWPTGLRRGWFFFYQGRSEIDVDLAWGGSDSCICMDDSISPHWCNWNVDFVLRCTLNHGIWERQTPFLYTSLCIRRGHAHVDVKFSDQKIMNFWMTNEKGIHCLLRLRFSWRWPLRLRYSGCLFYVLQIEEAAVCLSFINVYRSPKSQPSFIDSRPTCFGHSRPSYKGFCKYTRARCPKFAYSKKRTALLNFHNYKTC